MKALHISFGVFVLFLVGIVVVSSVSGQSDDATTPLLPIGVASIDITPDEPIRLCGYGSRKTPSEGIALPLHAKAIAIGSGEKSEPLSVFITFDAIAIPGWITEEIAKRLGKKAGVAREQLAVAATHTHCAPTLKGAIPFMFPSGLTSEESAAIDRYSNSLVDKLERVALDAIEARKPSRLSWGKGKLTFAGNRRVLDENGKWKGFGTQPDGPIDHSMPFLRVTDAEGKDVAVLINYACHCTTFGGDFNQVHGDWAGAAQAEIEKRHPGVTALIAIGCGADQNPNPRGKLEDVISHGLAVADEVDRMLAEDLHPLSAAPSGKYKEIDLPLDPLPDRKIWEEQVKTESKGFHFAKAMLEKLDRGEPLMTSVNYPVQTWIFGDDLAMVFLGGEVVVDYAHRFYRQYDAERLWINAYSNDVPCYIPTRRLYGEGGYEVDYSMVYYGKPSRLAPDTEDRISDEVTRQLPQSYYSDETLALIPAPVEKEEALSTIRVPAQYDVELVAAEPLVQDPVDIAWDTRGRLWAVEMADYPTGIEGKPGGRVRVLTDDNADGIYDTSHLFLDRLKFPNSVLPWRDGVLVVTADAILLAKDTDNDLEADTTESVFTGFDSENAQHQLGSLRWGPDNWVHVGNGGSKGELTSAKTGKSIDLGAHDMRFQPDTGEAEALSGPAQYGVTRDNWGNWFACSNSKPWWHYALDDTYLKRNPYIPYPDPKVLLTDEPLAGPVFPASRTVSRFNDYDKTDRFTSACGLSVFRDALPDYPDKTNLFVAEPVHNLISRILLEPDGSTFAASRAPSEKTSEFFASTDNWCRPTNIHTGPDGALYIVDMYRLVIEHPEWIPEAWQRRLNLRAGHDRGRIYRIHEKGAELRSASDLTKLPAADLAAELESANGTRRDLAHLELLWRNDSSSVPEVAKLARGASLPEARTQALCLLQALGGLDEPILLAALKDEHPGVRRQAICLSEPWLKNNDSPVHKALSGLVHDSDASVLQQLAYSLGNSSHPDSPALLASILTEHENNPYLRSAALSSSLPHLSKLVAALSEALPSRSDETVTSLLRTALGAENEPALSVLLASSVESSPDRLGRLVETLESESWSLKKLKNGAGTDLSDAISTLDGRIGELRPVALDESAPVEKRTAAIRSLGGSTGGIAPDLDELLGLLSNRQPIAIQQAAMDRCTRLGSVEIARGLLSKWEELGTSIRKDALQAFLTRRSWIGPFLGKLTEQPQIARQLDAAQRSLLLQNRDELVRKHAEKLLAANTASRAEALARYSTSLDMDADPVAGKQLFATVCSTCHKVGDTGFSVGPDLASLTNLSRESLLEAIVDPNKAVESKYAMYVAETTDGRTVSGVMSSEAGSGITLLAPGGVSETILRSQLSSLKNTGTSLMPEGLEAAIDPKGMADLLVFLQSSTSRPSVKPDEDGKIRLTPANGSSKGRTIDVDSNLDAFSWIGPGDTAEWRADIPAGSYSIFFDAGRTSTDSASQNDFSLTIGDKVVHGTVEGTGALNRLRKRQFGEIRIEAPLTNTPVRFQHNLEDAQLTIREIALFPR